MHHAVIRHTGGVLLGLSALIGVGATDARAQQGCAASLSAAGFIGQEPCGRVEERLRLDPRSRRDMSRWGSGGMFTPLSEGGVAPAHQRLEGDYGSNAPRLR